MREIAERINDALQLLRLAPQLPSRNAMENAILRAAELLDEAQKQLCQHTKR